MEDRRAPRGYTLLITTLSSFLTPFMSSAINLAMPDISRDFQADALALTWVGSAYLLASAAFLVPFGRAADLYGRRKIYIIGLIAFGVSSVLCAAVGSVYALIAFRALQGAAGAMIYGTAVAILTSVYPPEQRGRVLGINVASVYTGLSLGPVLGGFLTAYLGWRSIFGFCAIVALAIVPLVLLRLRREWATAAGQPFDWAGAVLYVGALVTLIYGISSIRETPFAPWLLLAGAICLAAFVVVEILVTRPVLDLARFQDNAPFIFSNMAALIHYSATAAISFLISLYLQVVQGMEAQYAGLILLAQPVVMAVLSPLAGWLSERVEARILASAGMGLTAAGLVGLSFLGAGTPIALVFGILLMVGLGYAFFSSPNTNAVMSSVARQDYGVASSTLGTMRTIGQSLSMAVVLLLFSVYVGRVQVDAQAAPQLLTAMGVAFRLFTGLCLLGMLFSLARGRVRQ